jgi:Immunity protein 72/Immunity protein 71
MGLLDFLKTKWTAGDMTEEDRKKVFWYLKRKTSYTAWKREADSFDRFADIFEMQVIEEPIAAPVQRLGPMNWEERYPEILKGQVLYEKALARLKTGDRSVWLYNELGLMGDALRVASRWHADIVHHGAGAQGDKYFDGKYVPDMEEALKDWFICAENAGYLEPKFTGMSAPELFEKGYFDRYQYPTYLPDVPVPTQEVQVRTGEEIPVFGIYEPQIKDGCMNYLLASSSAPNYGLANPRPVTWRLIWEDTRYLDGHIPSEEELYFPPQPEVKAPDTPFTSDLISASTGQVCPKSGNWAVMNDLQGKAALNKGDKMPQHQGRDVVWVWGS